MSKNCSNLRGLHFIWALQSLETGDKGSHPFPVATMEISPNTSKWCWRRKVAFGWDYSLVSAVCRRELVTVDWLALARHIEIWEFAHSVFTTSQSQVPSLGHTLPSKIMFTSLWSCFSLSGKMSSEAVGEWVLSLHSHTEVINRRSRGERMLQPSSGCTDPVLLWPDGWPWVHHSVLKALVLCREHQ